MADDRLIFSLEFKGAGDASKAVEAVSKALKDAEKNAKDLNKSAENAGSSFGAIFKGFLAAEVAIGAFKALGSAAASAFETIITDGVAAAQENQNAVNRLNQSLAANGNFTKQASEDLQAYADTLQSTAGISAEAVLENAALIESLTGLSSEGLEPATQAAVDLSAALGKDLRTTSEAIAKAANGNTDALKRFGVEVKKGATDSETFANALRQINQQFGGSALGQAQTYEGAIRKASLAFGEIPEAIGKVITGNVAVVNIINKVAEVFGRISSEIENNKQKYQELVAQGIIIVIETISILISILDAGVRSITAFANAISTAFNGVQAVVTGVLSVFDSSFKESFENSKNAAVESANGIVGAFTGTSGLGKVNEVIDEFRTSAIEGFAAVKNGAEAAVEPTNRAAASVRELTDAQLKLQEQAQKIIDQTNANDPSIKYELELQQLQAANDQKLIAEQDFLAAKTLLNQQYQATLDQNAEAEAQRLIQQNDRLLQLNDEAARTQVQQNNNRLKAIEANERLSALTRQKIVQDRVRAERVIEEQKLATVGDIFGNLASLTQTGNKTLFEIGKAAAIAQATVQGALAVSKALAEGGPFLGPILAAAIGVKTAVQIATISAQRLATGIDEVPAGFSNDTFPALLSSGERVVPQNTNQDLKQFLQDSNGLAPLLSQISAKLDNIGQQVTVIVGGKTLVDTLNDELRGGRQLAVNV